MTKSNSSETRWLPDGFHFLGPTEAKERQILVRSLTLFLETEGYSEVILPSMDYSASFLNTIHPEEIGSVLRFRDLNGQELSPGTDLTVLVVKGMAGLSHLTENQNVYYVSRRIRDHKKRNASRREILQLGAERIGSSSPQTILKILLEVDEILKRIQLRFRPTLVLGNTFLLKSIFKSLCIDKEEVREELRKLIHTKNTPGILKFLKDFSAPLPVLNALIYMLECMNWEEAETFSRRELTALLGEEVLTEWIHPLQTIRLGWNEAPRYSDLCIDMSLVRDLNYYSGFLFQGYMQGITEPIVTGGQYDHLYEIYAGEKKDACGYAINLDSLI